MIPRNFGPLSKVFANQPIEDEFSAGLTAGFARISISGKEWSIVHRGVQKRQEREDGTGAKSSLEIIVIKASTAVSKSYYAKGFDPDSGGSREAPDCSSANGIVPDANSKDKQSNTCAGCKHAIWGARITEAGKEAKACTDQRLVAVVPAGNIENEIYGGPMLLKIPPASLTGAADFVKKLAQIGYPMHGIVVRVGFVAGVRHQQLEWTPVRPLTDAEGARILELRDDPRVARILSESDARPAAPPAPALTFEQPPQPKPAPAPAAAPVPAHDAETGEIIEAAPKRDYKKKPAAPAPAPETIEDAAPTATSFDDELDAQLEQLLSA